MIQYTEVTIINDQYPVLTSSRKGIFFQKDYYDGNQIASENNIGYNIVPYGYFTYRHMSDDEIFYFNINNIIDNGIVSTLYPVFTTNNRLDSKFLQYELNFGKEFRKYSALQKQGGSRTYMYFNKLRDLKLTITTSLKEQECIRNLICSIDHLITLHQSKSFGYILEAIVSCTLYWEQRKFGELFLEKRDKTEIEDEDILLSCAITGIYLNSELFSHFRGASNIGYLKIKKNDLILSAQNLHLGNANVNLLFEHGIISPAYKVYELNKCDQYFVQSWVKKDSTKDFFLNATTEGASQCRKNIDWCILNNQLITIPSLYEQIRIGKLFHCLNHLITLHQLEPFQLIFKAIAYRIIDYAKSKPPRCR
nr:hypothetical protein [uncultured Lachnoanaerobaculum sp.]